MSLGLFGATVLPALAADTSTTTTTTTASTISCVRNNVNTREQNISKAMGIFTQSMNTAYVNRALALSQAYNQTVGSDKIRASVRSAWAAFNSSVKSSRETWKSSQKLAWSQFRTAVKSCKGASSISDDTNSASEVAL